MGAPGTALQAGGQAGGRRVLLTPPATAVLGPGARELCRVPLQDREMLCTQAQHTEPRETPTSA